MVKKKQKQSDIIKEYALRAEKSELNIENLYRKFSEDLECFKELMDEYEDDTTTAQELIENAKDDLKDFVYDRLADYASDTYHYFRDKLREHLEYFKYDLSEDYKKYKKISTYTYKSRVHKKIKYKRGRLLNG